jgi:hypothetical protein
MVWSSQSAANAYIDTLKLVRVSKFTVLVVISLVFFLLAHLRALLDF